MEVVAAAEQVHEEFRFLVECAAHMLPIAISLPLGCSPGGLKGNREAC
jgi:hypothetical protein